MPCLHWRFTTIPSRAFVDGWKCTYTLCTQPRQTDRQAGRQAAQTGPESDNAFFDSGILRPRESPDVSTICIASRVIVAAHSHELTTAAAAAAAALAAAATPCVVVSVAAAAAAPALVTIVAGATAAWPMQMQADDFLPKELFIRLDRREYMSSA